MADEGMRCDVAQGSTDASARPCGEYNTEIVGSIGTFDFGTSGLRGLEMLETVVFVAVLEDATDGANTLLSEDSVGGGVVGGVGGRLPSGIYVRPDPAVKTLEGARYVMPIALCRPVKSRRPARRVIVTSPGVPRSENAGISMR